MDLSIWLTLKIGSYNGLSCFDAAGAVGAQWKCWIPSALAYASAETKGLAFPYGSGARFSSADSMGPSTFGNDSVYYTTYNSISKTSPQVPDETD